MAKVFPIRWYVNFVNAPRYNSSNVKNFTIPIASAYSAQ